VSIAADEPVLLLTFARLNHGGAGTERTKNHGANMPAHRLSGTKSEYKATEPGHAACHRITGRISGDEVAAFHFASVVVRLCRVDHENSGKPRFVTVLGGDNFLPSRCGRSLLANAVVEAPFRQPHAAGWKVSLLPWRTISANLLIRSGSIRLASIRSGSI
jgi:hypothetical protein